MTKVAGWQPHRETFRDAAEQWLSSTGAQDRPDLPADLFQEREFAAAVLDTAGALVVVLDREGRIVLLNCYSQQLTGYSTQEVRGRPFWELFVAPEDLEQVKTEFLGLQAGRFPSRHENDWLIRDGSRRRIIWSNTALTGAAGAVEYIVSTGIDVTEQRQAEAAPRESEALNRSIIDNSKDCIKLLDIDGRLKFISEGGRHLLRIQDLARYVDVPYETFWQGSDRRATVEAIDRARAGEVGRFQGYCPTEDGTPKWWDVVISPILGADGQVERLLAVSRDVTEARQAQEALRASEAKLKALFDLLPIGVSILDEERSIVQDNPALHKIVDLSLENLEARACVSRTYLRPDGTPMPADEFPSTRAARENRPAQGEIGIVKEDGTVVWTEVSAVPVLLDDWRVVITTTDISRRKQAEDALRRTNEELERRVQERTENLVDSHRRLEIEIGERRRAEEELRRSEQALEQRVGERTRELATLLEISNAVALSNELEPLLQRILELLQGVVAYDGATVYRLENQVLTAVLHRGPIPLAEVRQLNLPVDHTSLAYELLSTQKPISIPDVRADTPAAGALRQVAGELFDSLFGYVRAWLGLPLAVKGVVVGLVTLHRCEPGAFDERETELAQAFAGQLAVALENVRLYQQAQELAALKERQLLARDLHDAVSQTLFSASLAAEVLPRLWEDDRQSGLECLAEVRQLTRGALAEMRTLLLELRPAALAQADLTALLRQLAEAASSRMRIPVAVQVDGQCLLPAEVRVALYRIAQEALNNIAKHADAQQVAITLGCVPPGSQYPGGEVTLSVTDDGRGWDWAHAAPGVKGMGLGIMRERAEAVGAALQYASETGRGTSVTVTWPANGRRTGEAAGG